MKRIRVLVLILCACFASVAWGQQPECKARTGWGQFHRYKMMRWNPCENVLNVDNVWKPPPQVELPHWRICVFLARRSEWGGLHRLGRLQRIRAGRQHRGPAMELHHWRRVVFLTRGGEWGGLCRLVGPQRVRTGSELWSYTTGGISSPAVANGVVYVGSEDGNVYAPNASTGAKL